MRYAPTKTLIAAGLTVVLMGGCAALLDLDRYEGDGTASEGAGGSGGQTATGGQAGAPNGWWDERFRCRQELTIDGAPEPVSGVAVLVRLDSTRIDYDKTLPNGADLRFVLAGNDDPVPHEVDHWDRDGTSIVWVKLPSVENGATVWMYYGSDDAHDGSDAAAVWGQHYRVVLHMGPELSDATTHVPSVSAQGTTSQAGRFGSARTFNGISDAVELARASATNNVFQNGATISAWVRANSAGGSDYGRILDKSLNGVADGGWALQLHGNINSFRFERGTDTDRFAWNAANDALRLNGWQHVAFAWREFGDPPAFYIDGQPVQTNQTDSMGTTFDDDNQQILFVGNAIGTPGVAFDGLIDEVRIANHVMTAPEALVDYRSMNDALVVYGPEEQLE